MNFKLLVISIEGYSCYGFNLFEIETVNRVRSFLGLNYNTFECRWYVDVLWFSFRF